MAYKDAVYMMRDYDSLKDILRYASVSLTTSRYPFRKRRAVVNSHGKVDAIRYRAELVGAH